MEAGVRPKGVAWAVVGLLGCGFSYSIGFQLGSTDATLRATDRFQMMADTYEQLQATPNDATHPGSAYRASIAAPNDESF
jgi:hypothetical protein